MCLRVYLNFIHTYNNYITYKYNISFYIDFFEHIPSVTVYDPSMQPSHLAKLEPCTFFQLGCSPSAEWWKYLRWSGTYPVTHKDCLTILIFQASDSIITTQKQHNLGTLNLKPSCLHLVARLSSSWPSALWGHQIGLHYGHAHWWGSRKCRRSAPNLLASNLHADDPKWMWQA